MRTEATRPSSWPQARKFSGLAHGAMGGAWAWLQLLKAQLVRDDSRVSKAIVAQLRKEFARPSRRYNSHFIGSAAAPVVAALGSRLDSEIGRLFSAALPGWMSSCRRGEESDVFLGTAGALLAAAEIEGHLPGRMPGQFIRKLQADCGSELQRLLAQSRREPVLLGMAHGVAGYLLALEAGQAAFGLRIKSSLRSRCLEKIRLEQLQASDRASLWAARTGAHETGDHSWCHGGPGIGLSLVCGYKLTGNQQYVELALLALNGTFQFDVEASAIFCCGRAGRAQILIEAFRILGDEKWLRRARSVAKRDGPLSIRTHARRRYTRGFHQGRLGLQYLRWRLEHPMELPLPGLGGLSC